MAYPADIPTLTTVLDVDANNSGGTDINATLLNAYRTNITATQTELGVDPAGGYATVVARLDAMDITGATYLLLDGTRPMTGSLFIGDTANAKMTIGATFNQAGNDNEILALKSSDVGHGFTDLTEADTFFTIAKNQADAGGAKLVGYRDPDSGGSGALMLIGRLGEAATTTKSTAAGYGVVNIQASVLSGTDDADVGADGNLFSIMNHETVRVIFDAEGTMHQMTADNDLDMLVLSGTTGTPKLWWDEAPGYFDFNQSLNISSGGYYCGGSAGLSGTLTLDDGANWNVALVFTGGILTGQTIGASSGATANWA